jgi:hypothetical protein
MALSLDKLKIPSSRTLREATGLGTLTPSARCQLLFFSLLAVLQDIGKANEGSDGEPPTMGPLRQAADVKRKRLKFSKFQLAPAKGWMTNTLQEKVNRTSTTVCPFPYPFDSLFPTMYPHTIIYYLYYSPYIFIRLNEGPSCT